MPPALPSASRHSDPCRVTFLSATTEVTLRFDRPTKITRYSPRAKYANEDVGRDRCLSARYQFFPASLRPLVCRDVTNSSALRKMPI